MMECVCVCVLGEEGVSKACLVLVLFFHYYLFHPSFSDGILCEWNGCGSVAMVCLSGEE